MEEQDQIVQEDEETEENLAHISMHAMNSTVTLSFKMMRVTGHVGTKSINIFIDYESSYNFIHPNVVNKLGLRAQEVAPLSVEVPDGGQLTTNQLCSKFSQKMQGQTFTIDLMVLSIEGCDGFGNLVALHYQGCQVQLCRPQDGIPQRGKEHGTERFETRRCPMCF